MPELLKIERPVTLPPDAMEVYRQVEKDFFVQLEEDTLIAANAAVAGGKCRQIANGAVYLENKEWVQIHDHKLDALEELIEELGGAPTLVLYEYQHDATRIQERIECHNITGNTPRRTNEAIARFNAGDIPVLLGHPASMGHGLNLQGVCHHVIWFGITWNLEHYDQSNARVYRQGQCEDTVFVYHIVGRDTLDETVLEVLGDKDRDQRTLLKALASRRSS